MTRPIPVLPVAPTPPGRVPRDEWTDGRESSLPHRFPAEGDAWSAAQVAAFKAMAELAAQSKADLEQWDASRAEQLRDQWAGHMDTTSSTPDEGPGAGIWLAFVFLVAALAIVALWWIGTTRP